jgi:hypothetical protein
MKLSDAQDYPVVNMSLVYSSKTNDVYQAVFTTLKYGMYTRVDGRWRALSSEDTSLENLSIIDILPEDYKVVTEMFDAAQKANRYLKYDEVREFEVGYTFDGSAEALLEAENQNGPLSKGFHAFRALDIATLDIERARTDGAGQLPRIYSFSRSKRDMRYYKINGSNSIANSKILEGELLLSITYKLLSTRDAAEVYNFRQIYQLGEETYIYLESNYLQDHDQQIDKEKEKAQNLEGIIIRGSLYEILESFTLWLVEVDPIGFELLRRMNRDGFIDKLAITEDLLMMHVSDDLMDKWFHKMTDYADFIELDIEINMEDRGFIRALESEVSSANSFTKSDFFERHLREDWVHPRGRNSNEDDEDDDEDDDEEIPDLTDADIEQLRKEALARKKASEKIPFTDVPPSLQELIRDMIGRIENKFDEEETDLMTADLKGFIAGRYNYTPSEMSSQMAKLLRALT